MAHKTFHGLALMQIQPKSVHNPSCFVPRHTPEVLQGALLPQGFCTCLLPGKSFSLLSLPLHLYVSPLPIEVFTLFLDLNLIVIPQGNHP